MAFVETATQYPSVIPSLPRNQLNRTPIKTTVMRLLLIGCLSFAFGMQRSPAETPTEAVDRIWNVFANRDSKQSDESFSTQLMSISRKIAHEQGTAVIAPIMVRSKDWKDEEVLIFATVVCCLPPDQAVPILKQYRKVGKPWEQQCATDLLIEIDDYLESQKTVTVHKTFP